jgi:phosphoglycerate kinase
MQEHAEKLSAHLGRPISYLEDVCGPAAVEAVKALQPGQAIFLGNLRYLTEEVSGFEKEVKLTAKEMLNTWLVRTLAPLFDYYVNDAFAAAHRNAPSMVAFQEILPTAGGRLLYDEYAARSKVLNRAAKPAVFVLGGAKISDAFGMMKTVLENGTADKILACGVTGVIMLLASGIRVGNQYEQFLKDKDLMAFVEPAREMLRDYPGRIEIPSDLAFEENGQRVTTDVAALPLDNRMFLDIGPETIRRYDQIIQTAGTIFVNGPAGVYENPLFETGTRELWNSIARAPGYSVIGGGDTVSAASRFIDLKDINYVCTAGGAMVRFLSGKKLPLIEAMEAAYERDGRG